MLRDGALVVDHAPAPADLEVVAVQGVDVSHFYSNTITLRPTAKAKKDGPWTRDGLWVLKWDGGYAWVDEIIQISDQEVTRHLIPAGQLPQVGDQVRLESYAFAGDPPAAQRFPFEEVTYTSTLGQFPAWFVPGTRSTWAIFVHGRGATREEALRLLPTVVERGFPSLVITYRNDEGTPASPDGYYHFGESEWQDLEAAVQYALDHGAEDVFLIGYSMGGAIVTNFQYQSPLAGKVRAVVLDAPVLSFDALIDYGAEQRGLPMVLTIVAKAIAGLRFDINWKDRHYIARAGQLKAPILLFHGDADQSVHIKTSDQFAIARRDLVTYVWVPGATHVRSWNMDPFAYQDAVGRFLGKHARRLPGY